MPSKGESMANIKCDQCGAEMDFAPLFYREGDLEITCLRCPVCCSEYVASVTDSALRGQIERYQRMARMIANRKMPEGFMRAAERLHAQNVQRSRVLRESFLALP